ncbi:uncharacterized protein LOC127797027 isoform X1 [Diospyros lotus]|uniref:uncharacterized protein LOC127797027 isoform X1 n=1 Tax=Diospyros lotus TaxID=55363 RepID=UPI002255EE9B|nr:uncharacterized protein LOC127797027 isoform X1 [Diospyros lotus]XP_052185444.1 uncharacterized protein LOC127797027 isoform X1 [Diospyros lotus]
MNHMGSCEPKLRSPTPHILSRISPNQPAKLSYFSSVQSKRSRTRITAPLSSSPRNQQNQNQEAPISTATVTGRKAPENDAYGVEFKTLGGCKLGISRYPDFEYDARGGTGTGSGRGKRAAANSDLVGEVLSVSFDTKTLYIPPLMSSTTRFLGLPLPPFLKIDVVPDLFRGTIDRKSGQVDLEFRAKFWFSVGSIYRAPPLLVETVLTSEESSKGGLRSGKGERLDEEGKCRLVGVATVDAIDDFLMDSFLSLPTECLASLNAQISFTADAV